jgi:hypothetical protein
MINKYPFWNEPPQEHCMNMLDVRVIPALQELASNNGLPLKTILSRLMTDFWNGKFDFYTLRPAEGDEVNEFDDVVTPTIDELTTPEHAGNVGETSQWVLTSRRVKHIWSRAKAAAVLVDGLDQLGSEYRPSEAAYESLSRMDLSRYQRINIYLPLFYMERADVVAWCKREKLAPLNEWSVPEHEIRKAVSRASIRDALERQLAAHPRGTREAHFTALKELVPALSGREFDRQWREITAKPAFAHFRDPGPRKKS